MLRLIILCYLVLNFTIIDLIDSAIFWWANQHVDLVDIVRISIVLFIPLAAFSYLFISIMKFLIKKISHRSEPSIELK